MRFLLKYTKRVYRVLEFHTFKDRDVLWRLPYVQVVRVSQLHFVIAVPPQQLVHGVLCKTLQHKGITKALKVDML